MTGELEHRGHDALGRVEAILQPLTGELVPADDLAAVAAALDALREHKRQVDVAIAAFTEAAVAISRAQGTKTLRAGATTVRVGSDTKIQWDVTELAKLRKAGLPEDRYNELVTEQVEYKVNGSVARQIAGSNPAYAKIIERAKVRVPTRQSASVS